MWKIFKKNAAFPGFYLLFILAVLAAIGIFLGSRFNTAFAILSGMVLLIYILGATFINEQYEEKHKGYTFLSSFPVKDSEILGAKFLILLVAGLLLTGFLVTLFSLTDIQPQDLVTVRSYLMFMASFALLMGGILYIGIMAVGYTKFMVVVLTFTTALGLVPMLILKFYRDSIGDVIAGFIAWLQAVNWLLLAPLVLVLYAGLYCLAVQVKSLRSA